MSSDFPSIARSGEDRDGCPQREQDEAEAARRLVADLYRPNPAIYWIELILLAVVGWCTFAISVALGFGSWKTYPLATLSILSLYRASIFSHEISHIRGRALNGYQTAWDVLIGIPLMLPSFVYVGMHKDHHKLSTYGTNDDPEYLPMAGHKGEIVRFAAGTLLLPGLCALRFVVLTPVGLVSKRFHDALERHASSLTINHRYERHMSKAERSRMYIIETLTLAFGLTMLGLALSGMLPWRAFAMWYVVLGTAGFINTIRALGAHRYESDGRPMTRLQQLHDSIDTPGRFWTELWAPVGLRYHALHHYFPGLPYHNLGKAYRRLIAALAQEAAYRDSTSPSLPASLSALWNHEPVMPFESSDKPMTVDTPPATTRKRAA